ncbi:MAG: hypothetical protein OXB88_01970 [Bacteriovoracales bacterium]|nr:hypothetical protein [Bacteriovoracales bacterium]
MMRAFKFFQRSSFPLRPVPVGIKEILFFKEAPCDIWTYEDDIFKPLFKKEGGIEKRALRKLVENGTYELFIQDNEINLLRKGLRQHLRQMSRTLGIGGAVKNTLRQMSLLSINMGHLYEDPTDDEALNLQYRSARNLINFLSTHKKYVPGLYADLVRQNHHYSVGHPLLSSLILFSFLKYLNHFSEREIELLVLSNYFKDIGMSLIPLEIFNKKDLNQSEKDSIDRHTLHSIDILRGRVPLNSNYLDIIGNHHNHTLIGGEGGVRQRSQGPRSGFLKYGGRSEDIKTILVLIMDIMTAMISPRPYRSAVGLFPTLDRIKYIFAKDFQSEFHHLIYFSQQFLSRVK